MAAEKGPARGPLLEAGMLTSQDQVGRKAEDADGEGNVEQCDKNDGWHDFFSCLVFQILSVKDAQRLGKQGFGAGYTGPCFPSC